MKLVIIESPFAGQTPEILREHLAYGQLALKDSLERGEAPFASHLFYPLVLRDDVPDQRELGMKAGWAWMAQADLVAVYMDQGMSPGMAAGVERATALRLPIEYRWLGPRA